MHNKSQPRLGELLYSNSSNFKDHHTTTELLLLLQTFALGYIPDKVDPLVIFLSFAFENKLRPEVVALAQAESMRWAVLSFHQI